MTLARKYDLTFFTATILEWKPLLLDDLYKDVVVNSLRFLATEKRIEVHAFAIMINHIHIIWRIVEPYKKENVHQALLGFTAKTFIKDLQQKNSHHLESYRVNARDRKYQIWERNPLSVSIWTEEVLKQKLNYIHLNPVKAGYCEYPETYKYSTARLYDGMTSDWDFVVPCFL
jgi:REP element-mobilizing transposase RayT